MSDEQIDVLIVGGGLSGIAAAAYLQKRCPGKTYVILESRDHLGGTWDLFRYPGIRSDSDMFTLGYSFKPWTGERDIADGDTILEYLKETARELSIDRSVRFRHRVTRASWSAREARWTLDAEAGIEKAPVRFICRFLFMCNGYYDYAQGYTPEFAGRENFTGPIVHPQQWPQQLDFSGKRVVVIGSGATAVTIVPALAASAAKVTMLQRSPSYVIPMPYRDKVTAFCRQYLPAGLAFRVIRWRNILFGIYLYERCRSKPRQMKQWIARLTRRALGEDYDVGKHFNPRYDPWDQRLCIAPGGDLFKAIRKGRAQVVTDEIDRFTATGVRLRSGDELEADIIVTATGLNVLALGGLRFDIDGHPLDLSKSLNYKGCMFSDVPNLAAVVGYTNASWTLKCELVCRFVCRLLNYMDRKHFEVCVPRNEDASITEEPWLNLTSGYVRRAADRLPKQGSKMPWRLRQNYVLDALALRTAGINDGIMRFLSATRNAEE